MKSIRARLAALAAGYLLALLSTSGLDEISPELSAQLHAWMEHGFELLFLLGYAVRSGGTPPAPTPARPHAGWSTWPESSRRHHLA
ncbi:MAG TPA: hypothetical protein VF584_01335 [Longimicrobium sp.]|jgi:hypothetical protein